METTTKLSVFGFKVFNPDFTCLNHQFSEYSEHKLDITPILCKQGFHFCPKANDCFSYYPFKSENIVCEVEAIGELATKEGEDKYCTNHIRIGRRLEWHEVLALVNQGKDNTGRGNSGNLNSGNLNSGDRNSGDWNSGDDLTGVLCTKNTEILMFDKPSGMTLSQWRDTEAYYLMRDVVLTKWISWSAMSAEEKEQYPRAETQEGYLKRFEYKQAHATWWTELTDRQQALYSALPGFDAVIFKQITGIEIATAVPA